MSTPGYPKPEQIGIPETDDRSPDQEYYVGWLVQHNRLWVLVIVLTGIVVFQSVLLLAALNKPRPIQYVSLDAAGVSIAFKDDGTPVIGGTEYSPARLRWIVGSFIQNRYAYDWQNPDKLRTAFVYLSPEARVQEAAKLSEFDFQGQIVAPQAKVDLQLDLSNWTVTAQGKGVFEVSVQCKLRMTNRVRFTTEQTAFTKDVLIKLVVRAIKPTDTNIVGFEIISTGKDIL